MYFPDHSSKLKQFSEDIKTLELTELLFKKKL